jgi:hypothetical protein
MVAEVFRGIRQSLQKNSEIVSRSGDERFLLNPVQFIIQLSYHPKLYSLSNKPQINSVACRLVAGQRPRDKQKYNNRY